MKQTDNTKRTIRLKNYVFNMGMAEATMISACAKLTTDYSEEENTCIQVSNFWREFSELLPRLG